MAPLPSRPRIVTSLISYGTPSSSSRKMKRVERVLGQWNNVIMIKPPAHDWHD
jgi:hypothetical protein